MKTTLLAFTLAASFAAGAALGASPAPERTFHANLYQRYCDRLADSPEAYVQFVRRLKPIHGYTYTDFAPEYPGAPVKVDCKVGAERVAAVHRLLASR
ncbi:MAG TPA: hypothetical protein VM122_06515 [Usitatibacter sp.]|nr:hypothetical protein [Usitatibacter sp.]